MSDNNTSAQKRRGRINKADVLKIVKARNIPKDVVYDVLWAAADLGYEFNRDDLAAHDAELTEKVRRETLAEVEATVIAAAPPMNAELSMRGGEGPFVDKGMEAYIEGFHDAYAAIRTLSTTPTPERSNT
jgi:hypothetical protein